MSLINVRNIFSLWRKFQSIMKFTRIYFQYIKFAILIILILVTMLPQSFHKVESGDYEEKIRNLTISIVSFNPILLIVALLIGFLIKQIFHGTLLQNTVIVYIILLRGLEILPFYYLYQFIYTDLSRFDSISTSDLILYCLLVSLRFSNQMTIYIRKQYRIQLIKTRLEYVLQIFLIWRNGFNQQNLLILFNRLLIIHLYANLTDLFSNEIQWKKFISFTKFNPNETKSIDRLSRNQLTQLFPSIDMAYLILIIRSIILSIICYNIYQLIGFST